MHLDEFHDWLCRHAATVLVGTTLAAAAWRKSGSCWPPGTSCRGWGRDPTRCSRSSSPSTSAPSPPSTFSAFPGGPASPHLRAGHGPVGVGRLLRHLPRPDGVRRGPDLRRLAAARRRAAVAAGLRGHRWRSVFGACILLTSVLARPPLSVPLTGRRAPALAHLAARAVAARAGHRGGAGGRGRASTRRSTPSPPSRDRRGRRTRPRRPARHRRCPCRRCARRRPVRRRPVRRHWLGARRGRLLPPPVRPVPRRRLHLRGGPALGAVAGARRRPGRVGDGDGPPLHPQRLLLPLGLRRRVQPGHPAARRRGPVVPADLARSSSPTWCGRRSTSSTPSPTHRSAPAAR